MDLPELKIGQFVAKIPIVQGGMGVGISLSTLAGEVALNGGIGVISGVEIGFNEPDYLKIKGSKPQGTEITQKPEIYAKVEFWA